MSGTISAYYDVTGVSTREHGTTFDLFHSSLSNFTDRPPNRGVTFALTVPVFDWGRGREAVARGLATLRESELAEEDQRVTVVRQVRDIVRRVAETAGRLEIHERNRELAERSYRVSRLRFENGGITSQELALAQQQLSASQLGQLEAFISYRLAVAELKKQTLWDFERDCPYTVEERYTSAEN